MQASGVQYGVAEASQFMVGRGPPSHNLLSSSSSPREQRPYCSRSEQEEQNPRNLQQQQHLNVQMVGMGTDDRPPHASQMVENHTKQGEGEGNYSNSGGGDDDVFGGEVECERVGVGAVCTGNRWPRQETLALLKIRSEMDPSFRDSSLKGPLWEHVSRRLEELGYHRDPKKCKEKFENLHKYYKRTKEGRTGRQDGKSYRFFSQLEALYANNNNKINGSINTVTPVSNGDARISDPVNSRRYNDDDDDNNKNNIGLGGSFTGATATADPNLSEGISFSSDSSEKEEEEEEYNEPRDSYNRKRKRSNSKKKVMALFEKMMKQMMEKQDRMQQMFLQAIEKREQDRAIREETWRRKEIARLNRDEELRSQERSLAASRDLALVSFLQKFTGQTFSLDPHLMHPHHDQEQEHEQELHVDYKDLNSSVDPNSKRWPKPEVLALIKIRSGMNNRFQEAGPKGPLWEEISAQMASLGYDRSAKRCKEKWENINKYYKKAKESNKRRPENAKTCPYFHQLDALYRRAMLNNPNKLISMHDEDIQDHQEELLGQASGSNREESAQGHGGDGDGDGELLVIMPPPDSDTGLPQTPTSNTSTVPTFFSNPQNPSAEEGSLTKGVKQQNGVMKERMDEMHENLSAGEGNSGHQMKTIQISVMSNLQDHEKQKHGDQLHSSTARDSSFMEIVQKFTAGPPEFKLSSF